MELAGLLSALEAAARAEADGVVLAAAAQAEAIAAEREQRRSTARSRARAESDAALASALDAAVRSARRDAASAGLQAQRALLDEVRARARALLASAIAGDAYRASVPRRLKEALDFAGPDAVVRCAPALESALREVAERVEPDAAIDDGFEVIAGDVRVDARLSTELARRWPELALALGSLA